METNKQWKRVPHNLALSTKIINGLIEGRIVSDEDGIVYIELPEETPKHEFKVGDELNGTGLYFSTIECKNLEKISSKHEFKPFDKVLVRDNNDDKWVPDIFRYYGDNYPKDYPYRCCANDYKQCIPYEGNEHLVGTTNNPE